MGASRARKATRKWTGARVSAHDRTVVHPAPALLLAEQPIVRPRAARPPALRPIPVPRETTGRPLAVGHARALFRVTHYCTPSASTRAPGAGRRGRWLTHWQVPVVRVIHRPSTPWDWRLRVEVVPGGSGSGSRLVHRLVLLLGEVPQAAAQQLHPRSPAQPPARPTPRAPDRAAANDPGAAQHLQARRQLGVRIRPGKEGVQVGRRASSARGQSQHAHGGERPRRALAQ